MRTANSIEERILTRKTNLSNKNLAATKTRAK